MGLLRRQRREAVHNCLVGSWADAAVVVFIARRFDRCRLLREGKHLARQHGVVEVQERGESGCLSHVRTFGFCTSSLAIMPTVRCPAGPSSGPLCCFNACPWNGVKAPFWVRLSMALWTCW